MKGLCTLIIIFLHITANFLVVQQNYAQQPEIISFEPRKASFGEIITISGSGFASKADLQVTFGSVVGKITESNSSTIRVAVPAGAAYAPISVTNLLPSSGFTAYTNQPFMLSFGGLENGEATFDTFQKYSSLGAQDVCACDLDGDGRNDLVGSTLGSINITTYLNNGSPGTINFTGRKDFTAGIRTFYVTCGDLNGDGKADLVYTGNATNGDRVAVMFNTSIPGNINFAPAQLLQVTGKSLGKPAIQDLNADGKPEIILTNQSDNQIIVFQNTSSPAMISFDPAFLTFNVSTESASTFGLRVKDVNQDGLADITASSLYGSKVFFLINKTISGSIDFQTAVEISVSGSMANHELEDMDGDGKMDLLTTDIINNRLNIHLNNSTDGSLSFSTAFPLSVDRPMGLQLGDLNGDKKPDILAGNNNGAKAFGLINTSTKGSLSFNTILFTDALSSTGKFANVGISDLDGDAIPDVIAADRENSVFYTFRNLSCIHPSINPSGTVNICSGSSVILSTIQSPGSDPLGGGAPRVSYQWLKDGVLVGTAYSLEVASAGKYQVKMTSASGCSTISSIVNVQLFNESMGSPTFSPISTSCAGEALTLSVTPAVEGATYTWTNKTSGFSVTTTTNSVTIEKADPNLHAGIVKVVIAKNCQIELESPEITVYPKPVVSITPDGALSICSGESRVLSAGEGFSSYQWKKNGQVITENGTSSTFSAKEKGSYSVVAQNSNGCQVESQPLLLDVNDNLKAAFEGPAVACLGQPVQFNNKSTWATGKVVNYIWDFGDGTQSSAQSPSHTFNSIENSPYTVSLRVQYEGSNCTSTYSYNLTVTTTPEITIETVGPAEFCAGDSVKVQIVGDVSEVNWSNGRTGKFIYSKEGGLLQANVLTSAGCTTTKSIELTQLPTPKLEVSSDKAEIGRGESANLSASGGISYLWEPAESLDDPTVSNPVASPERTTTYKVKAMGEEGCFATGEITITVDNSFRVDAPKLFVPATDLYWTVKNIENYPEISITIINKFGKPVFSASSYQNDWDGSEKGKPLNDGVYFYVFKDLSGSIVKTGSITLVR